MHWKMRRDGASDLAPANLKQKSASNAYGIRLPSVFFFTFLPFSSASSHDSQWFRVAEGHSLFLLWPSLTFLYRSSILA